MTPGRSPWPRQPPAGLGRDPDPEPPALIAATLTRNALDSARRRGRGDRGRRRFDRRDPGGRSGRSATRACGSSAEASAGGWRPPVTPGSRRRAGEWVAFLDDDDLWSPDKLRLQLDAAAAAGAGFAYGGAVTVDDDLEPLHRWRLPAARRAPRRAARAQCDAGGCLERARANGAGPRARRLRHRAQPHERLGHVDPPCRSVRAAASVRRSRWLRTALHEGQESRRGDEMIDELDDHRGKASGSPG